MSTIGPVAVGVTLAFAWNMTLAQPQRAADSGSGVTHEVGLTVDRAAAQAWASAMPGTAAAAASGTALARTAAAGPAAGSPSRLGGTWWAGTGPRRVLRLWSVRRSRLSS